MEILDFSLSKLHNEEHFQFQTGFNDLMDQHMPPDPGLQNLYSAYTPLYSNEKEALDIIVKSDITNEVELSDALRDSNFRGMADTVKGFQNHFNPDIRKAAARVQVVLDNYGNLTIKSYDDETAAINSLVIDLLGSCAQELAVMNMTDWPNELQNNNSAFDALTKSRYSQEAAKTQFRMKQVRHQVDAAYRTIVKRINALIEVNGDAAYTEFVNELNERIEKYDNTLAIRKGRNAKKSETKAPKS